MTHATTAKFQWFAIEGYVEIFRAYGRESRPQQPQLCNAGPRRKFHRHAEVHSIGDAPHPDQVRLRLRTRVRQENRDIPTVRVFVTELLRLLEVAKWRL